MPEIEGKEAEAGRIFYDGECTFCRGWIGRFEAMLRRRGFDLATLQDEGSGEILGVSRDELLTEMRVRTPGGAVLGGADALAYVVGRIGWARPLLLLWRLPGMRRLARAGYRVIAARRHCLAAQRPPRMP